MASRHRNNGHRHHSRKQQSSEQTPRRRLSKQEEIDLTTDFDCSDKNIHMMNGLSAEPTSAPTIHVNSVEDKCGQKPMVESKTEKSDYMDLNKSNQSMNESVEELGKSFADKLDVSEVTHLSADVNREKKRGKFLARAEAVRDTSASPPPTQSSDNEDNSHDHSDMTSNSQSQSGYLSSSDKNNLINQANSSGSLERSSPSLSRDSSTENYSDLTGTDVQQFLMEALQKQKKDRVFLLKIEQDLNSLVLDKEKTTLKFPQMTSYNRMLVHRVAALFGFEHNVDIIGTSVIVNKCKNTRIPDMKFKDYIKEDSLSEPKKSILKRDSASLEDGSSSSVSFDGKEKSPDRQNGCFTDSSRSKSFEEREELYKNARARIFNQESSSSTDGIDTNAHLTPNNSYSNLLQRNSSPRSSQSNEDIPTKMEVRTWVSSDKSGPLKTSNVKGKQQNAHLNSCSDSDTTIKAASSSSSSSCGKMSLLAPDGSVTRAGNGQYQPKNRPYVTKASSFGEISRNADNSWNNNSSHTQNHLTKSNSFNGPQNSRQVQSPVNALTPNATNRSNTPKNSIRQDIRQDIRQNNAQKPLLTSIVPNSSEMKSASHQPSVHSNTASHHNRHNNWYQNPHPRHQNSHLTRENVFTNNAQWPHSYPHYVFQQQNDSNLNHLKESYLQSGQAVYLSSVPFGAAIGNEQGQFSQTPIRLIYPNQSQLQSNGQTFNPLPFNSVAHQTVSNQMGSVPFPLQSSPPALNFTGNQSTLANNPLLSHSYGAPIQIPSNVGNVGTVWIINNGVAPQSNSPLLACPPPANTPPTGSVGANIAPFVGMSYQQYRPAINSNATMNPNNPNMSGPAAQTRGTAPLLKGQPMLTSQSNNARILNGNPYLHQQVPDVDMNQMIGANSYMSRGPPGPPANHLRRGPVNSNQGLDVRLMGSQAPPPFLLPTPQRPYFPVSNSMTTVNHRSFYANNTNNANQRSKHSFSKSKPQNNRYNANRNVMVPNANINNCPNI